MNLVIKIVKIYKEDVTKMYLKKLFAFMLSAVLLTSGINVIAKEEVLEEALDCINIEERIKQAEAKGHRYAYVIAGDSKVDIINGTVVTNRWNSSQKGASVPLYNFNTVEYQGKKAMWPSSSDSQCNIFTYLEGEYWNPSPGKRFAVTIEYIDIAKGSLGVFTHTMFHKLSYPMSTEHEAVITQGTGEWKTVTYYIDDYAKGMIRLRTPAIQPFFGVTNMVPIGNIFIEEDMADAPFAIDAEASFPGRILSYGNSEKLNVTYENTVNSKLGAEVKYKVKNYEGRTIYSGEMKAISLDARQSGNQEILTGVTERGTYTLEFTAAITDESGDETVFTKSLPFSIIDTMEEGEERNPLVGVCDGISDNFYGGGYSGAEQLTMLPISGVRLGGLDNMLVETSKGTYTDPILADRKYHSDNGVGVYVIAYKMQSWYNGGRAENAYPNTDTAHQAYANYAAYLAKLPYIDTIEMFNEWNHSGFSTLDQSADGYLEYCKVAYPAIKAAAKEAGRDVQVLAGGTAGFAANWIERFIKLGGLDYCDGLSYHPYQYRSFDYKSFKEQTEQVTKWMLEYHGSLKPITLTEMGLSEADDMETTKAGYEHWNKMRSLPGMYIMAQHLDVYDRIYYYSMHSTGYGPDQREPGFGLFEFVGKTDGSRLAATDAAVTLAAYMDKLTGTTPGRKIEADEYKKLAYEFTKTDGSKIAALWTSTQHANLGINLGVNEVKVYDQFGNFKEKLYSPNGCYSFDLTDEIIYIEGNFDNFEETASEISLSSGVVSGLVGDIASFSLEDLEKRNLKVELDYDSEIFTFEENGSLNNGKATFRAKLKDGVTGRYHIGIKLLDSENRVVYYARPAVEITTEMLDVKIDTAQFSQNNDRRWVVNVYLKNISATKNFYGKVVLAEPIEYADEISFSEVLPGEERLIKINLPEMVVKRPQQLKLNVALDNGFEKTIAQKLDFTSAKKVQKKPVIDGRVDKDEWNSTLLAEDRGGRYTTLISGTKWNGINDLSVKHKVMWDEDNFYMMAMVNDNVHYTAESDFSTMWKDDSIQFGILANREETLDAASLAFTELCISANPSGDKIYRHSSASGKGVGVVENCELKIERNGECTIYEMRIPWTELLSDSHKAKAGDEYAFSFLINDNDGGGRKGYMYYNDGIGGEKLASLFGKLRLN